MPYNTEEINQLIRNRRSIFPAQYTGEAIDDEIIKQILENANYAPNHLKTQPWRFMVFKGNALKKLGQAQAELYKNYTSEDKFNPETYKKLQNKPAMASHVIAIGVKRHPIVPEIEEIEAVACAVQNMYLTATAYGLGAYWGSGGITYYPEAKELFGLDENDKLLGFFFLGVPKHTPASYERQPIEDKVIWADQD